MANLIFQNYKEEAYDKISIFGQDLDQHINGLNTALESIGHLSKLRDLIVKLKKRSRSKPGIKIAKLAIENISRDLSIEIQSISLESLNEEQSVNISLETITEFITKIWDAIKKTFQYIWDKIFYIFKSKRRNFDILEKQAEANEEIIEEIVSKHTSEEVADIETQATEEYGEYILDEKIKSFLGYLNKEMTDQAVLKQVDRINANTVIIKNLVDVLEKIDLVLCKDLTNILEGESENITLNSIGTKVKEVFGSGLSEFIEQNFMISSTIDHEAVKRKISDTDRLDYSRSYRLEDFIAGGVVYAIRNQSSVSKISIYDIIPIRERHLSSNDFKMPYMSLSNLEILTKKITILVKDIKANELLLQEKLFKIKNSSSDYMKYCNTYIANSAALADQLEIPKENIAAVMQLLKLTFEVILKSSVAVTEIYEMQIMTIRLYSHLSDINKHKYSK